MTVQNIRILIMTLLIASSAPLHAAIYDIDLAHSQVGFGIRHLVSTTKGNFNQFSGTVDFKEDNLSTLKVLATIETKSVDTNNAKRDEHLKSADFFNVEKFPTMTFKSSAVKMEQDKTVSLTGELTMLGVTKPVTLSVQYFGSQVDPWGNMRVGFSARGKLNRKDFGMVYNITDKGGVVIGDDVTIEIEIEGIKQASKQK